MAVKYTFEKHAVAFPTKVLARNGGEHIYNIRIAKDMDNGTFVGKGDFMDVDEYAAGTVPTGFELTVRTQMENGNYLVEMTKAPTDGELLFLYNQPVFAADYDSRFTADEVFYNAKGDDVSGYVLAVGDYVEISADGFDGDVAVDAKITAIADSGKAKIGA